MGWRIQGSSVIVSSQTTVAAVAEEAPRYHSLLGSTLPAFQTFLVRAVDCRERFGIAYLLNNGCVGVFFRDSTRMLLSPCGRAVQYAEKARHSVRRENSNRGIPGHLVMQEHVIGSHPQTLHKKITLIRHFSKYLLDEEADSRIFTWQQRSTEYRERSIYQRSAFSKAISVARDQAEQARTNGSLRFFNAPPGEPDIHVVHRVHSQRSTVYLLSNSIFQVVFNDGGGYILINQAAQVAYLLIRREESEVGHEMPLSMAISSSAPLFVGENEGTIPVPDGFTPNLYLSMRRRLFYVLELVMKWQRRSRTVSLFAGSDGSTPGIPGATEGDDDDGDLDDGGTDFNVFLSGLG